jgi:hypothetical protein
MLFKKEFETYPILWNIVISTNVFPLKQSIFSQSMRSNINHLCLRKIMLIKFFFYFELRINVCTRVRISIKTRYGRVNQS